MTTSEWHLCLITLDVEGVDARVTELLMCENFLVFCLISGDKEERLKYKSSSI